MAISLNQFAPNVPVAGQYVSYKLASSLPAGDYDVSLDSLDYKSRGLYEVYINDKYIKDIDFSAST